MDSISQIAFLLKPVRFLKGVGDVLAENLSRLKIETVADLLFHIPYNVVDRRETKNLADIEIGSVATLRINVTQHFDKKPSQKGAPYKVLCAHNTGFVYAVFFNGDKKYLQRLMPVGAELVISGKVERFGDALQIPHPDFIVSVKEASLIPQIQPVYNLTEGITNRLISKLIQNALSEFPVLSEWIDENLMKQRKWLSMKDTLNMLHNPESVEAFSDARSKSLRLAYDEVFAEQLALAIIRSKNRRRKILWSIDKSGELKQKIIASLGFELTNGQKKVIKEIEDDLASGERMIRLLQGDVGSGKTAVALITAADVIASGKQVAIMAPTGILAKQHYDYFSKIANEVGFKVEIITGADKSSLREAKLRNLQDGSVDIIVGTHALFQESISFNNLGLVIIDEQHRFGVEQRLELVSKGEGVHTLLMTATPIPRSLALTLYGDMDVSRLTEKPVGRKEIDTRAMPSSKAEEVMKSLKRVIESGTKAYWICPLVEESEVLDLKAVEERYKEINKLYNGRVGLVHGRLKPVEREQVIADFAADKYDILVATTVIEVGINVPSANVIIIDHAERFGLSQLHQLRGRVGRSDAQAVCILLYSENLSKNGVSRLKVMRESNDGFYISEEDLKIRGGGEVMGTKQSGDPHFRFFDFAGNMDLIEIANSDVKVVLNRDANLLTTTRGKAARNLLYLMKYDKYVKYLEV